VPNLVRVVVIDDHPMFREGAVSVLVSADGIEVVDLQAARPTVLHLNGLCPGR
jgi:DNA-binding NarL/FixJ family response regulator